MAVSLYVRWVPLSEGDHIDCPVELLGYSDHRNAQRRAMGALHTIDMPEGQIDRGSGTMPMKGDRVPDSPQVIGSTETSDVDEPVAGFDLARILEECGNPELLARMRVEESFLRTYIFEGLNDLKPAFDSAHIAHFRAADFLWVIARCNLLDIRIIGIEIFGPAGEDVDIEIPEAESNAWCVSLVQKHQDRIDLSFCATYAVPDCLLALPPTSLEFLDRA